ncbi:unknown [[Mannheimia] succiniciproducens MBEL55E]|uniref:Uncharacterized protein n=1 Tax=Mannheimia succiniciproducens (strain KCTC 0769BP / MBEL55E) TaxID=221988 RepID=Q65QI3_MANSM|nr:unknown [[Mannheimia] succiniciproducens MBEL55E]
MEIEHKMDKCHQVHYLAYPYYLFEYYKENASE